MSRVSLPDLGLAMHLWGAVGFCLQTAAHSALLDHPAKGRQVVISLVGIQHQFDRVRDAGFARIYWKWYLDVGRDEYFGQDGVLGTFGAREHYNRQGAP